MWRGGLIAHFESPSLGASLMLATRLSLTCCLVASSALTACSRPLGRSAKATVVDSGGVRISEWHAEPETFPVLTVSASVDSFRDDARQGYFGSITDVQVAPRTGRVFVLDGLDARVYVFSRDGEFLTGWGRRGMGPGEFDGPVSLAVHRDTVAVVDSRGAHFYSSRGTYLGSVGVPFGSGGPRYLVRVYATQDGWFATVAALDMSGLGGVIELHRVDPAQPATTLVRELFAYGHDARVVHGYVVGPLLSSPPVATLDDEARVFISRGGGYEIAVRSAKGNLERLLRVDAPPLPVTPQLIDEYVERERKRCEQFRSATSGCPLTDVIVPAVLKLPVPAYRPKVRSLAVISGGTLMVERADLDPHPFARGDSTTFDLLAPDGVLLARFKAPPGLYPRYINNGTGWGYQVDEVGVAALVRFTLR